MGSSPTDNFCCGFCLNNTCGACDGDHIARWSTLQEENGIDTHNPSTWPCGWPWTTSCSWSKICKWDWSCLIHSYSQPINLALHSYSQQPINLALQVALNDLLLLKQALYSHFPKPKVFSFSFALFVKFTVTMINIRVFHITSEVLSVTTIRISICFCYHWQPSKQ